MQCSHTEPIHRPNHPTDHGEPSSSAVQEHHRCFHPYVPFSTFPPMTLFLTRKKVEKHFRNTSADPFTGLSMRYDDAIPHLATRFAIEKFIREQNAFLKESSLPVGAKRKERQQDPEERASKKFSPAPVI